MDVTKEGADHYHSVDAEMLKQLVTGIELFQQMKGTIQGCYNRPDRKYATQYRRGVFTAKYLKKGDVLAVAQVAGIMGAKKTPDVIPMCHPLLLTNVDIAFTEELEPAKETGLCCIKIKATVKVTGQTGVEMEALTAVSIAALTIYDMCKAVDREMYFTNIGLLQKSGGKSGAFSKDKVGTTPSVK